MPNAKRCKQCGELKPIEQFRKYYGNRKGHYTICKTCEKINSRFKYLTRKGDTRDWNEDVELQKINQLYDAQRACGLQPPHQNPGRTVPLAESLDDMISQYKQQAEAVKDVVQSVETACIPDELIAWLNAPLTQDPDYYLDEVYEQLKATYMPATHMDPKTMLPVRDETYKPVLDKILDRFYQYEDEYYDKE